MRISHDYGVIFLANPKCASNTVERYLRSYTGDAHAPPGLIRHLNASGLEEYMRDAGLDLDDYLVFTTIRNPWDRLVSLWEYAKRRPDSLWYDAAVASDTLGEFLRTDIICVDFVSQFGLHGFTHNKDGFRTVDDVLCTEHLEVELPVMFQRFGFEFVGDGLHENRSVRKGYRAYYTDEDRDLVRELFSEDIVFGDYAF